MEIIKQKCRTCKKELNGEKLIYEYCNLQCLGKRKGAE